MNIIYNRNITRRGGTNKINVRELGRNNALNLRIWALFLPSPWQGHPTDLFLKVSVLGNSCLVARKKNKKTFY